MANFQTHITVSSALGVGYGVAGYFWLEMPAPSCVLAAGLCSVSGMLPDLDSGPGVPLRESMAFAAAVVPMMLLHHFKNLGMSHESIILAAAGMYLLIRFGLTELLKHYTVHRGMFHSIPAMLIAGELAFLAASGDTVFLRGFKAAAVSVGFLSHLVLDELWALQWRHGRLQMKSSFGTALKFFGNGWWPNISTLGKLAILTALVAMQPDVSQLLDKNGLQWAGKKPAAGAPADDPHARSPLTQIR